VISVMSTKTSEAVAKPKFSIVNVVATAELGQPVDLERLVNVPGFLYDYEIYHCAYLKDSKTKAKISIFSSGKMISIGTKSLRGATQDLKYAAQRLVDLHLMEPVTIKAKVQNIVAVCDTGSSFDLELLSRMLQNLIYEPEQFPGAIYWAPELQGAAILIFPSGKIVVSGLKRHEMLRVVEKLLVNLIYQLRNLTI